MIETKILGDAVGVQRGDVIDNSETTVLPSLNNGVIAGHFKRGRMDKPFKVTSANYRSLLGHDPKNASYLAVEDAFKRGVSELSILRTGSPSGAGGAIGENGGGGDGGGGQQNEPANFFKIHASILKRNTESVISGLLYTNTEEPLLYRATYPNLPNENDSSFNVFLDYLLGSGYYHMDFNINDSDPDVNYFYIFGVSEAAIETWETAGKNPFRRGVQLAPTTYSTTYYPSTADFTVPPITNDLFDLIIDPTTYTQQEIDYFAQWGIEPALKNMDGSITAHTRVIKPSGGDGGGMA